MRRKVTNFVDDIKIAQPAIKRRTTDVDLINGHDVSADMGQYTDHLSAIGDMAVTKNTVTTAMPTVQPRALQPIIPAINAPTVDTTVPIITKPPLVPAPPTLPPLTPAPLPPSIPTEPPVVESPAIPIGDPVKITPVIDPTDKAPVIDIPIGGGTTTTPTPTPTTPVTSEAPAPTTAALRVSTSPNQIALPSTTAQLSGTVTGGTSPTVTWTYVSGPQGVSPVISNPNSAVTDVANLTLPGEYTFKITAKSTGGGFTGATFVPTINIVSENVVITVLAEQTAPPAENSVIDTWGCDDLTQKLAQYNALLASGTISDATRIQYENALLYINSRKEAVCTPQTQPNIDNPGTVAPTQTTVPALPSTSDVDAMNCDQLAALKASLTTHDAQYRADSTLLQNYLSIASYVDVLISQNCSSSTPTAPTAVAVSTGPYGSGGSSGGGGGVGGGGGGVSSSKAAAPTVAKAIKKWWWIGVIVVGAAVVLYKPGTQIGKVE